MEISDTKIAIGAIVALITILTATAYLAGVTSETLVIGLASTGIAAVAGLAGYDMGKKAA
jgi:hypothetical protein